MFDLNTADSNLESSSDNFDETLNCTFESADILFSWLSEIGIKYHVVLSRRPKQILYFRMCLFKLKLIIYYLNGKKKDYA